MLSLKNTYSQQKVNHRWIFEVDALNINERDKNESTELNIKIF